MKVAFHTKKEEEGNEEEGEGKSEKGGPCSSKTKRKRQEKKALSGLH